MKFIIIQAATNMTSGFGTSFNIFVPVIMIGIASAVLSILLYASADLKKYRRLKEVLKKIACSSQYTAYGTLTFVVVVVPCYLGYLFFTTAVENPDASLEVLNGLE